MALGLPGEVFFWELATLIDIMLLGHWIEMKSVMGASAALESLVRLMPAEAHLVAEDGSTREVPVSELKRGDRVLGDATAVARWVACELALDEFFAEVLPDQKAARSRRCRPGASPWP